MLENLYHFPMRPFWYTGGILGGDTRLNGSNQKTPGHSSDSNADQSQPQDEHRKPDVDGVINGYIAPINGRKYMAFTGVITNPL